MAKGFDDLIEFLLEEIALRGEQGASTSDFKDLITRFYAEQDSDIRHGGRPDRGAGSTQHADRRLQERVWTWLTAHPDICLNGGQSDQMPSLTEFEALEGQKEHEPPTDAPKADGENGEAASASAAHDATPKLFVNEERMWMAMTGHGVDAKRIPRHEFIILSIIAAHGEKGVVQPEITRISGQDKRSVPKRTDNLAKHGYITKVHVLAKGTRTSLCTLKRYAKTQREKKAALPPIHARSTPDEIKAVIFQDGLLLYDKFFDILMDILKDCKIVTIEDCKRKLGITTKTWEMKSLWRSMRRLEGLGLVKKVKAQIKGYAATQKWYRCIKMVREPTQRDRMIFVTMSMKEAKKHKRETEVGADEDAEGDLDPEEETEEAGASQALVQQESDVQEIKRLPPQWDPDRPVINLLWDIIKATGPTGATTANIRDQGLGTFYRRPIDAILGRISDIWHISQPPHLRHFAIIRDTGQSDKYLHYVYRSYGNFQLAVDVAEAAWEVVITQPVNMNPGKKPRAKNQKNVRGNVHHEYGELNEWGFPQIHESSFESRSGMATLKDSVKTVMTNLKPLPSRGYLPSFINGGYVRSQREVSVDSDDDFPPASSRKKSTGVDKPKRPYVRRSTNGPGPGRRNKSLLNPETSLASERADNADNDITMEDAPEDAHFGTPTAKRPYKRKKLLKAAEEPEPEREKPQPGVYVNPDWGKKPRDPTVKGRPKKAKVVVIVLDALKGLDINGTEFTAKVADSKAKSDALLQEARDQAAALRKEPMLDPTHGGDVGMGSSADFPVTSVSGVYEPSSARVAEQIGSASIQPGALQPAQTTMPGPEPHVGRPPKPPFFHMLDELPPALPFSTPLGRPNASPQVQQISPATLFMAPTPTTPAPLGETPSNIPKKRGRARKDPNAPPMPRKSAKKNNGDTATGSAANGRPTQQLLSTYLMSPAVGTPSPDGNGVTSISAATPGHPQPKKRGRKPKNQTPSGQIPTPRGVPEEAGKLNGSQPDDSTPPEQPPTTSNPFVALAEEYQRSYPALYTPPSQPFNPFIAAAQEHNRSVTSTPVPTARPLTTDSASGIVSSNGSTLANAQNSGLNISPSSQADQVRPSSIGSNSPFATMQSNPLGQARALNGHGSMQPYPTMGNSGASTSPSASTYLGGSASTTSIGGSLNDGSGLSSLPGLAPAATRTIGQQGVAASYQSPFTGQQGVGQHRGLYDQLRPAAPSVMPSYQSPYNQASQTLSFGASDAARKPENNRGPLWGSFSPLKAQPSSKLSYSTSATEMEPTIAAGRQHLLRTSSTTQLVQPVSPPQPAGRADKRSVETLDGPGSETDEEPTLLEHVSSHDLISKLRKAIGARQNLREQKVTEGEPKPPGGASSSSKVHNTVSELRKDAQPRQSLPNPSVAEGEEQLSADDRTVNEATAEVPAASEDDTMQDAPPIQDEDGVAQNAPSVQDEDGTIQNALPVRDGDHDGSHPSLQPPSTSKERSQGPEQVAESGADADSVAAPPSKPSPAPVSSSAAQKPNVTELEATPSAPVPFKKQKGKWAGGKKQGVKLGGGGILNFNRTKLLVSIIEKCGGVFPGDFEIHRPFVGMWNKEYGAERQVDRDTIKRTIKNSIESCKVRRFAYSFKNKNGVMTTRHILTLPNIEQSDSLVLETQKKVIATWPRVYTPPQMKEYEEEIGNSWYGDKYEKDTSVRVERANLPAWMRDMELRTAENQRKREEERTRRLEREAKGLPRLTRPGRGRGGRGRGGAPRPVLTGRTGRKRLAGLPRPAADPDDDPWNPFQSRYLRPYDSEDDENISEPATPTRPRSFSEMSGTFQVDNFVFHRPTHDSALASDSDDSSMIGTPFSSRSGTPVPVTPPKKRRRSSVSSIGTSDGVETPGRIPTFKVNLSNSQRRRGSDASVSSASSMSSFRVERPRTTEWSFRHAGPDTYDPTWHIQDITTLTDPDILFYPHTGTFSTEYHVVRDARLSLWIQPHAQHQQEFEDAMPRSYEEMKQSIKMKGKERDHTRRGNANLSRFERELIVVSHWEDQYLRKNDDLGLVIRQPHFINHTFYGSQEEPDNEWEWTGLKWGDIYSQTFTPFEPPSFDETDESDAPDGFIVETGRGRRRGGGTGTRATKRRKRAAALGTPDDGAGEPRRRQRGGKSSKTNLARAPTQDPLCVISTADTKRLLYAMVVVQSLLGGVEAYTSWDQIRKIFRTHERWDLTSFRNRWVWLKTRCAEVVENLFDEFQQAYLLAYECGDVPPIDYDNVDSYDWDAIVKWTMQNISIKPPREADPHANLPTSRKELEDAFVLHEVNDWSGPPKESLYNEGCLSTRRKELTQQYSFYLPLTTRPKQKEKSTLDKSKRKAIELAKTWVRATIVVPEEQFDMESFGKKLNTLDNKTLDRATSGLISTKYFRDEQKGRTKPGRNYGVDRTFPKVFERQLLPAQLIDAMRFKKNLDDAFAKGAPAYTLSNAAKDGHVLATINLAQGGLVRIRAVLPPVDHTMGHPFPRLTKWGFTEGHYKTVQMDRSRVTWTLEIAPTDRYIYGNPLLQTRNVDALPPPPLPAKGSEHDGFVPLWADLFEKPIWEWWHRVTTAILHVVFGRPGIGVEAIGKALKEAMGEWEIELCVGWLVQVGALEEMKVGVAEGESPRGWRLGEWWWCILAE